MSTPPEPVPSSGMSTRGPLLNPTVYYGVLGALLGLATMVAAARLTIRIYVFRRLYTDDYFFLLSVAAVISSSGLFFALTGPLYYAEQIQAGLALPSLDFLEGIVQTANIAYAAEALAWVTVYAVKFSFLFYFRSLIKRIQKIMTLWWVVFVICVPAAAVAISAPFIECPYVGNSVITKCNNPAPIGKESALLYYGIASDIITDLLIISIPVFLLRQTSFNVRQKLSIGTVLCLSIIMIFVNLVRGISSKYIGVSDQLWTTFWIQFESCISVITVSMTAFRTLFVVSGGSKKTPPEHYQRSPPPLASRRWPWKRSGDLEELPELKTGATIRGIRTIIHGNGRTAAESFDFEIPNREVSIKEGV